MVIHPSDNVEVRADGHKYALRPIAKGENVIKYGMPVGHATADIAAGEHVHTHNLATNLGEKVEYRYAPRAAAVRKFEHSERPDDMTFSASGRSTVGKISSKITLRTNALKSLSAMHWATSVKPFSRPR